MKPTFFYKTWSESSVGSQLRAYTDRCNTASETARLWAEQQGADSYIESPEGMAGGIAALIFPNTLAKEGYERIVTPDGEFFFLPSPDTELEKQMYALPIISETELIPILQFKPVLSKKTGKTLPFTFGDTTPVIFHHHGWWYFNAPYQCEAESLTQIDDREFYRRRMAFTNEQALNL